MKLSALIADLESLDDSLCMVAKRPWSSDSEAIAVRLTNDFRVPDQIKAEGYEYFLEVHIARDEVLGELGASLSADQRLKAILFYAENDAYPEWLCEMRQ